MRIAIYPGSFDPPTYGHLDVVERATTLFDKVIVAVGENSSKSGFLSVGERLKALSACTTHLTTVEIASFDGLLVEYCRRREAKFIIRGLRAVTDFDTEFQMSITNRQLAPDIDTVLLMTKWEFGFISSTLVREVARLGGDLRTFVPAPVLPIIERALQG
ncbi:MAG: pantetheine-phosphate adenylyltransferase [Fimbriimonadaceae bacterium]|jgi:pantetheine-phosphate adenylyltransferase|nr:pantetheine-phosphate adenylyltransferase [Fimbriimonadaceae bacterium]